ncbi:MAG: hypothetical protein CL484_16100 [Acidobacteria bacterium]|nr:hypothetical protein [Acidobacteriota bacterium]|tara:strand:+ start:565 stop:1185 length:621 start_codon:yes stop_codon:yes gene_type:complete
MAKIVPTELAVSAKQLVFLVMIAAVVAVVVFLCGVLVGQGMPRRDSNAGSLGRLPDAAGRIELAVPGENSDFQDPAGSSLQRLSYFERLHSSEPVAETFSQQTLLPARGAEPQLEEGAVSLARLADRPTGSPVFLQITTLRVEAEAYGVVTELRTKGYPAFVEPLLDGPVAMYRVRTGPYAERVQAEQAQDRLETEELFNPWVVQP